MLLLRPFYELGKKSVYWCLLFSNVSLAFAQLVKFDLSVTNSLPFFSDKKPSKLLSERSTISITKEPFTHKTMVKPNSYTIIQGYDNA